MRANRKRVVTLLCALVMAAAVTACDPGPTPSEGPAACNGPAGPPDAVTAAIYNRVNTDRAANGLGPLAWNGQLYCLASDWSAQMSASGAFQHRDLGAVIHSPDYSGYRTVGENILFGPTTMSGEQMEDAWMASPTHRENILSPAYTSIGIATATADGARVYATQNFGG